MKRIILTLALALTIAAGAFAKQPIKVACVGNSITFGMTIENQATDSYPAQLQKMLGDSYLVGNFGKSGATLTRNGYRPYNEQEEYRKAIDFAGDIVVIHLGTNDTDPRVWPHLADEFVSDYLTLIDSLRAANPAAKFYIANLSPISDRHPRFKSGTRDWRDQIRSLIKDVAQIADAQLIDFETPLLAYPTMLPDGLHPNKEGASHLASTVYSAITGDFGGLQMPPVYTDHMVLPAGRELTISGTADAGSNVELSIGNQNLKTITGTDGSWSIDILPLRAGGPYTLQISSGDRTLKYDDVMAGAVWLASGQSNMEFRLRDAISAEADIAGSDLPNLRFFDMKARWLTNAIAWSESALDSVNHLQYYHDTTWQKSSPATASDFSAIAYHFGRILADSLDMPVGIICNAVGGSPTESWIDRISLEHKFPDILANPTSNDFIQPWVRQRTRENIEKSTNKLQRHPYNPAYLYECGIAPLSSYPIDGVIWYQGESNAHNIEAHERLFDMLIDSWRDTWHQPQLPFLFVQLSSLNRTSWPQFRDSQRQFARDHETDNIYMVVSSDMGDSTDVHPRNKRPIGERLARVALHSQYGYDHLTAFAPSPSHAEFLGDSVFIQMTDNTTDHLLATSDALAPSTFEVARYEGQYYPAKAEITPDSTAVIITSDAVTDIRYIRYGWQPFTRANLINRAGLPVSTFKISSDIPAVSAVKATITHLPALKGSGNYSKGVSAAFAGRLGKRTIVAGGANFPKTPAEKGGSKVYYDEVVYLTDGGSRWVHANGKLPYPVAYGASFTTADGIICAGGITDNGPTDRVFRLNIDEKGKLATTPMPALPAPIDNAGAAYLDNCLYITGGNVNGVPSNKIFRLDLADESAGWQLADSLPGNPRTQPATSTVSGVILSAGGFAGKTAGHSEATLDNDVLLYIPGTGTFSSPVPGGTSLGGGTATLAGKDRVIFTGGVNAEIFLNALRNTPDGYLSHPAEWYRFNNRLLLFDMATARWSDLGKYPDTARAGAMAVPDGEGGIILIGGELKPGVRTNSVVKISLAE